MEVEKAKIACIGNMHNLMFQGQNPRIYDLGEC